MENRVHLRTKTRRMCSWSRLCCCQKSLESWPPPRRSSTPRTSDEPQPSLSLQSGLGETLHDMVQV